MESAARTSVMLLDRYRHFYEDSIAIDRVCPSDYCQILDRSGTRSGSAGELLDRDGLVLNRANLKANVNLLLTSRSARSIYARSYSA